jgi:hypothetical protein
MDLFETILKLSGIPLKGSPAEQFLAKLDQMAETSPLDPKEYILDGCRIHCTATDGNTGIRINDMQSMVKGSGSIALSKLCALADEFNLPLSLTAKGFSANPTPIRKLVEWYSRFGFVTGMGNMKEGYRMVRKPKGRLDLSQSSEPRVIKLSGFNKRPH